MMMMSMVYLAIQGVMTIGSGIAGAGEVTYMDAAHINAFSENECPFNRTSS